MPASVLPNNGPPPTALPAVKWGQEKEVTRLDRMATTFYKGGTNFTDLYYPSSGLGVTSVGGVCTAGSCSVGNVGAACTSDAPVLAVDRPRLLRALDRPRPPRHREPHPGARPSTSR